MSQKFSKHKGKLFLCVVFVIVISFYLVIPRFTRFHYKNNNNDILLAKADTTKEVFIPSYIETPENVKGIYMTSWTASSPKLRENLVDLIDKTELNSVVIDIKDYSGKIVFPIDNEKLKSFGSEDVRVRDLRGFIETLHKKNIYVIGRIAVFQDAYFVKYRPDLAVKNKAGTQVWKDRKGISWIDAGSREYWDYIVLLSKESRNIGFDEINFDYIRYPSDGDMEDISFTSSSTTPKALVLKDFFQYLNSELSGTGLKISADLFGMVTTAQNDMGIGQVLENALPYFDFISPMVYPSHYPPDFEGFSNPEAHPYEIVNLAMKSAVDRANKASTTPNKFRPWLQDFGLGMKYGQSEVRAQIKAINDLGLNSWLLWSASNRYTEGALDK